MMPFSQNTSDKPVMLLIIAPPILEESLVDWLLETAPESGFTTLEAEGHGTDPRSMSAAERVAGRRRNVQFQVLLDRAQAERVIELLHASFGASGLVWCLLPALAYGRLESAHSDRPT